MMVFSVVTLTDDSIELLHEVDRLIENDNQNYIRENIFGSRARSEQRTLENFSSPPYTSENKDNHFLVSQNKFNEEKKAREMLSSFMNKYVFKKVVANFI